MGRASLCGFLFSGVRALSASDDAGLPLLRTNSQLAVDPTGTNHSRDARNFDSEEGV